MAVEGILLERVRDAQASVLVHRTQQSPRNASERTLSKLPSSFETPRASSASTPRSSVPSSVKSTPSNPKKYVSQMAKAREEKKRQAAAAATRDKNGDKSTSSSDMETSSYPSSVSGTSISDMSTKKSGQEDKLGNLPKFGEWDKHSVNSGPCYTLLFQNAAQEKRMGGPVPVHGPRPSDYVVPKGDLYGYRPPISKAEKKKNQHGLLCCFKASEVS